MEQILLLNNIPNIVRIILKHIKPNSIIFLYGDMGSGKSTIAYEIIKQLKPTLMLNGSPTFSFVNSYDNIHHWDLYNLKNIHHLYNKGFFSLDGIFLIEWPEKIEKIIDWDIFIKITLKQDKRICSIKYR